MSAVANRRDRSELVGRERELATIERAITDSRLVTLTGLGGIGKTSLARAIASGRESTGGRTFFVDLVEVDRPAAVVDAVAAVVGAADQASVDLLTGVAAVLDSAPTMLVLDNFEHVLEARRSVAAWLAAAPSLRVLTTSRIHLGLPDEAEIAVGSLTLPTSPTDIEHEPASALFLHRARSRGRLADLDDEDAAALVEICRRLDGIPLALELAAAWSAILLPRAILRRIRAGRLDLSGVDPRQASVAAVVRATLDLVDRHGRSLFPALGVFAGPFDEPAACAITADEQALTALRGLEGAALVRVTADASGEPRFELLETIRAVALEELASSGDLDAARRRHAAHYADRAVAAADAVRTSSFHEPAAGLVLADPNMPAAFTSAIELGESELAVRIAAALAMRAIQTGILREAIGRLRVAVELPGLSDGVRSDGWNAFVSVRGEMRELDGLAADAARALAYARSSGTPERIVRTLITVGNWTDGDRIPFYAEAGALADEIDYAWGGAVAWETLSGAYWMAGRSEDAMRAAIRAHEASERHGDRAGFATRLASRGEFELNLGRIEAGIEHLGQAWAIFGTHPGQPSVMTWALAMLAAGLALAGRLAEAYQTLAEAARLAAPAESDLGAQDWLEAAAIVLQFEHPVAAARCLGLVDRIGSDLTMGRTSARLDAAAARRVEGRIGRRRLEAERAAGRAMDARALFTQVARLVRTTAGPATAEVRGRFGALTAREIEILGLLAEGHTDRSIAARLGISPKTASVHVSNLKGKLGVETRVEAVLYAREGLDVVRGSAGEGTGD